MLPCRLTFLACFSDGAPRKVIGKNGELIYQRAKAVNHQADAGTMRENGGKPRLSMQGAGAILVDAAGPLFDDACQGRIWAMASFLRGIAGVSETVPGMNNLMVVFDPLALDPAALEREILSLWDHTLPNTGAGRTIEVPVVYGGESGEDLSALAHSKGMSVEELVALHSAPLYSVAAVGAMPGFVYLSGLNPRLATPRRAVPRMNVPVGSVIIGGAQAGIMPLTAPSGWHIIGSTGIALFDPHREPPAAFRPGDRIRFVPEEIRQ